MFFYLAGEIRNCWLIKCIGLWTTFYVLFSLYTFGDYNKSINKIVGLPFELLTYQPKPLLDQESKDMSSQDLTRDL